MLTLVIVTQVCLSRSLLHSTHHFSQIKSDQALYELFRHRDDDLSILTADKVALGALVKFIIGWSSQIHSYGVQP